MDIVKKIQILCKENNITVGILEKRAGFSKGAIYKWHNSSPTVDGLMKIADYFNVSLDYLCDRNEESIEINRISQLESENRRIKEKIDRISKGIQIVVDTIQNE